MKRCVNSDFVYALLPSAIHMGRHDKTFIAAEALSKEKRVLEKNR